MQPAARPGKHVSGLRLNARMDSRPELNAYWLAETLRLREAHWGPLDDSRELRQVRASSTDFPQKILLRATLVGRREGIDRILLHWRQIARLTLAGMLLAAILAGAGTALGALGDGARPVNLLLAVAALLGLHAITFILWLLSFALEGRSAGAWLGRAWLWLTQKLARGPDGSLAPRALAELLARHGSLRWALSAVSHGLWVGAMLSALLTMLAVLSARRYGFNWETTLLSPDTFVALTKALGWLPGLFGFAMPGDAAIRASDGLHALPESAQALWSSWLIGCLVVYGLLPRLAGFLASFFIARRGIASIAIDESLPGYAELRERLQPASEKMGIDAPAGHDGLAQGQHVLFNGDGKRGPSLVGLELPPGFAWPPAPVPAHVHDLGVIDTGPQRKALLDYLHAQTPDKLLIVCDGRQTPDRGAIGLVAEAASQAGQTRILLLASPGNTQEGRLPAWLERLAAAGIGAEQACTDTSAALEWVAAPTQGGAAHA